ncbi:MAG: sigma 54-interacting transcriptional regulator [Myxococcota bacterium]
MNDPLKPKPGDERFSNLRHGAEIPSTLPVTQRGDAAARRLLVIAGERVSSHALPDAGEFTVGRGDEVDLRIDDPSVSRVHARLFFEKGKSVTISDAGSSNGTRVRGKRLQGEHKASVPPGETFEVGNALLMIQAPFEAEAVSEPTEARTDESGIVIGDRTMASLYQLAERVAKSTINVLLLGETGVGKDVLARRIHAMSPRAEQPFLPLNCGALPDQLLESELFGHEKGSFTGATDTKQGLLEAADRGTVFLDEVGELPMSIQVKLLRVLEDRQARRVGGIRSRPFDIRFIAATNRDLSEAVQAGTFRADLYYRLNGISLYIPPLRQRVGEIEELTRTFVEKFSKQAARDRVPTVSDEASKWLQAHQWPGNIRELQNSIERAVLLATGDEIGLEHLPASQQQGAAGPPVAHGSRPAADEDPERTRIIDALEQCAGNQTRAAKLLGISRNTLLARLDAYGIPRPRKPRGG